MAPLTSAYLSKLSLFLRGLDRPMLLVLMLSLVVGLLMVLVFRYASDQKAIRVAKNQLKAHLLAVRLFQDQLPVVLRSYARLVGTTGGYLRLACTPLILVTLPLAFLVVQLDRYLAWTPVPVGQQFMVKAHTAGADSAAPGLRLPAGISATSPALHIPEDKEVIWRVVAERNGEYDLDVSYGGESFSKRVVISSGLARLSPVRLQDHFWERLLLSSEPPLPPNSHLVSIEVVYPPRSIRFAGLDWNWIWLFLILSLVAGLLFKTILRIEI